MPALRCRWILNGQKTASTGSFTSFRPGPRLLPRSARPASTRPTISEDTARSSSARDLAAFRPGEILVAPATSPDWEPVMKVAAGIITDKGGRTCHAAIVARELGIPAVVGATGATEKIKTGTDVTICCA